MRIFYAEALGTFILASSLNFMADYSNGGQKVSIFEIVLGFLIAVQFARKFSGAHVNPGVTLACYLTGSEKDKKKIADNIKEYIAGQFVGGFLSPIISQLLTGHHLSLKISIEARYIGAFIMEMIGASVFYTIIVIQGNPKLNLTSGDGFVSSACVSMGLASGISIAGNESGAGLNPAISVSQNIISLITTGDIASLKYTLIYILAPVAGAYLTQFVFNLLYGDDENTPNPNTNIRDSREELRIIPDKFKEKSEERLI